MTAPVPYLFFDGVAAQALRYYQGVFGGELSLHSYAEFGRDDGPADALAHGILTGAVDLYAADVAAGEPPVSIEGMSLGLLGAATPEVLREWFAALRDGGQVVQELEERAWDAFDGTVRDRFGVTWLLGYKNETTRA